MSYDILVRMYCDTCGTLHKGTGSTDYEAAKEARRDGWEVDEDSGDAQCPSCQKRAYEEKKEEGDG